MKKFLFLLLLLCSVSTFAQDVIVKKDGTTIVCRVVEVNSSEVIYKRWSDLQGSNYVMNLTDVSAINYENGTKKTFGDAPAAQAQTQTQTPNSYSTDGQQQLSDDMLMKMASTKALLSPVERKIKRLKIVGWVAGGICLATGISLVVAGAVESEDDIGTPEFSVPGVIFMTSALIVTPACLIRANKLKQSQYSVQLAPLFQQAFHFKNGSSLATSVDLLKDSRIKSQTIGIGLHYNF